MHEHSRQHTRRGPTSYAMQDAVTVFERIELKPGDIFFDLGCGAGDYTFHGVRIVGETGVVHAMDRSETSVRDILRDAETLGIGNLSAVTGDILDPLPFDDASFDVCLASTVLHCVDRKKHGISIFHEVRRILKPGGIFAVIECSREDMSYGPGALARIDPEELEDFAVATGFIHSDVVPMGFNYLAVFHASQE